ncbi:MAG: ABC transporter ATP-binding protein [Planctomycetia bacterium]|nr:ABC transporter ATP-binding protein [Planctomycetia bacterium]
MSTMQVVNVHKHFVKGGHKIDVLRGVHLDVHKGEYLSIIGQSGSGKSTLLHAMGLLMTPSEGEIYFQESRIDNQPARTRDRLRNNEIAMIFQFYHLLPELTMLENVLMPTMIKQGALSYLAHRRENRERAKELLERVGLTHRLNHYPRELSGGEMQRTAIARALMNRPSILLADEPTGNLDREAEGEIITLLRQLNKTDNLTIVMVTHNPAIAQGADRMVQLSDGYLIDPTKNPSKNFVETV